MLGRPGWHFRRRKAGSTARPDNYDAQQSVSDVRRVAVLLA
jgi:hypothetical protein